MHPAPPAQEVCLRLPTCIPHFLLAPPQLWFSHVLRDAFAAQAAGKFRPFKDVGAYHLEVMLRQAGKDARCVKAVRPAGAPDKLTTMRTRTVNLSLEAQPEAAAAASSLPADTPPHTVANMPCPTQADWRGGDGQGGPGLGQQWGAVP